MSFESLLISSGSFLGNLFSVGTLGNDSKSIVGCDTVGSCCFGRSFFSIFAFCCLRSFLIIFYAGGSELAVELDEVRSSFCGHIALPEFEVSRTLEEFTNTLRLLDTREFYHDTSFLAFQRLDVGLYDAKAVDTRTDDVE